MVYLGSCKMQFARNLLKSKQLSLVSDRLVDDNPTVNLYSLPKESKLLLKIYGDVKIVDMSSDPHKGNKSRSDFYFKDEHLDDFINVIEPFIKTINVEFDDAPRSSPDPTGMEHSSGILLGHIFNKYSTNLVVSCTACYAEKSFCISDSSILYIEPEIKKGKRFHMGISMKENISKSIDNLNGFEIYINYADVKRLLYSIKIARKILKQQ